MQAVLEWSILIASVVTVWVFVPLGA